MKQMANTDSTTNDELCDAIDEYFRQKFRKVSFNDAKDLMCGLGAKEGEELQASKI